MLTAEIKEAIKEQTRLSKIAHEMQDKRDDLEERYGVSLAPAPSGKYHAIVIAVPHNEYMGLTEDDFMNMIDPNGLVVDIYGIYRNVISQLRYWSL